MRRALAVLLAFGLLGAACGDDSVLGSSSTTGSTAAPSTEASATSSETSAPASSEATTSTTMPPTTTTATSTTTSTTTTTIAPAAVTTHAYLPGGALGRHLVPWTEVGADWVLALYSGDEIVNWTDGPTVLYLVSPDGDYYEITAWAANSREPYTILDWSPNGERALLMVYPEPAPDNDRRLIAVDLATGAATTAFSAPETTWEVSGAFTAPTGRNVVVSTDDGTTERLEVHRAGGANAVLVDRPSEFADISWLYGRAGTSVVVSDVAGVRLLDNQGAWIRDLAAPGEECRLVRWWSADEILAACQPTPLYGGGHWYHQLWIIPVDGSAATSMTAVPANPPVVDLGYWDARRTAGETLVQWWGDCGTASVTTLQADGTVVGIPTNYPVVINGVEMITTQGPRIAVRYWDDCGMTQAWLGQIRLDGTFLGELIPKVADTEGVTSAIGMG